MSNVIKGELFIVPNGIAPANKFNVSKRDMVELKMGFPKTGTPLVQVWARSESSENWGDHGFGKNKEFFPTRLPLAMLKGKKEGDLLTLEMDNGDTIELTCCQLEYRYKNHGRFEEVIEDLRDAIKPKDDTYWYESQGVNYEDFFTEVHAA